MIASSLDEAVTWARQPGKTTLLTEDTNMAITLAQAMSRTWQSEADALKELKRSKIDPHGATYDLGEFKPGSWQLIEKTAESVPAERPKRKRPKLNQPAAAKQEPKLLPAPPPAEPEPPPEPEPLNDLSNPPTSDGPYHLAIGLLDHARLPQFNVAECALGIAKSTGFLVSIIDRKGKVVRTIDGRISNGPQKRKRGASRKLIGNAPRKERVRGPSGEMQRITEAAVKLAQRKQGVTRKELAEQVSDRKLAWTIMLDQAAERMGLTCSHEEAPKESGSRTVYKIHKP
jgi:hypothetical protein